MKDFFLSHASKDKSLVRQIYQGLLEKGLTCWFDEAEILPGDSLVKQVFSNGIKKSKYVIVFISDDFLSKNWPKAELETVIAKQIRENKYLIIPYLVGISHEKLVNKYPFFENIYCGDAEKGVDNIIKHLEALIKREQSSEDLVISQNSIHKNKSKKEDKIKFELNSSGIIKNAALGVISRLIEKVFIEYHRAPNDLCIDVIEYSNGYCIGVCNYAFWGPDQATPYKSLHPKETIVSSINDAISGIISFDSAEYPNELVFWVSDEDIIYDGNGLKIELAEAYKRRENSTRKYRKVDWTEVSLAGGPWWLVSKNFTTKEFSVIGPIENDSDYVQRCLDIQKNGIDFRLETIPVNAMNKDEIINYFCKEYNLKEVGNDYLYNQI